MANVLDQAQNVQGVVSAARKRDAWSRQEANATDDAKRRSYREAIFDLEQRFPDLGDVPVGGAEAFARQRGHGRKSRSPVHGGRQRHAPSRGSKTGGDRPKVRPASSRQKPAAKPTREPSRRSAPTSRPTPRVDRAIAQTGVPSAASSAGSLVMSGLGVTVGLSLFYLVVSSAEQKGSPMKAFPSVVEGVTKAVGRFIEPEDVFPGNSAGIGSGQGSFEGSPATSSEVRAHEGRVPQPGVPAGPRTQVAQRHQEKERRRQTELRRKGQGGLHR